MSRSNYKRGYIVELRAKDDLMKMGATCVIRSSRSLTPADLVAIFKDKGEILLVQVKGFREIGDDVERLRWKFFDLVSLEGVYRVVPAVYGKVNGRYRLVRLEEHASAEADD